MHLLLNRPQLRPIRVADDRVEEPRHRLGRPLGGALLRVAHQVAVAGRIRLLGVMRRHGLAARNGAGPRPRLPAIAEQGEGEVGPAGLRPHQLPRLEMLPRDDQLLDRRVEEDEGPGLFAGPLQRRGLRPPRGDDRFQSDEDLDRPIDLAGGLPFGRRDRGLFSPFS